MNAGQNIPGPDGQKKKPGAGAPPSYLPDHVNNSTSSYPPGKPASASGAGERRVTRTGVVWAAVVAALILLILLIIFILQNQELVLVKFLGLEGSVPLGMALFISSVAGAVLVAAVGGARILQLRANAHRTRAPQRR